jgi:DNA polymerase I-like protein with 3'-5' exonuclease and polymerase domains
MPGNEPIITPIQGGEAEFMIAALADLAEASVKERDPYLLPKLCVHDDLTLEVPDHDDKIEYYMGRATEVMNRVRFPWQIVPLVTEVAIGYRWSDVEEIAVIEGDYVR